MHIFTSYFICLIMKKIIVQFEVNRFNDIDRLFHIEETLFQSFSQSYDGYVDGHDIGQDKFNIYIHIRSSWASGLERVYSCLKLRKALSEAIVVKFHPKTERYEVVMPTIYSGTFSLL